MINAIPFSQLRQFLCLLYAGRTAGTAGKIRQMIGELEGVAAAGSLCDEPTVAELTTGTMLAWRAVYRPQRAPCTIAGQLTVIGTICRIAYEEGWLERLPNLRRLRPRVDEIEKPHFSADEIRRLLGHLRAEARKGRPGATSLVQQMPLSAGAKMAWANWRLYVATAIVAYTGMRRDECLCLRIEDIDLVDGIIRIVPLSWRALKTKKSKRIAPIRPELREILIEWLPQAGPIFALPGVKRQSPWRRAKNGRRPADELKQACVGAGIAAGTWQSLRRSWAVHAETLWMFSDGLSGRILGHSPEVSKRFYRRADVANLASIAPQITFGVSQAL